MKTTSRLLLLAVALALAACGNKGPLVLPDQAGKHPASPASPASDATPQSPDTPAPSASPPG